MDFNKKPIRPRRELSSVAKFSSAPGSKFMEPTAAYRDEEKRIQLKYAADKRRYHLEMKAWHKAHDTVLNE